MSDSEKTRIIVQENQLFMEVWLEDAQFRSLAHSSNGNLDIEVPPGIYALKARLGNETAKKLVSVDGGEGEMRMDAPKVGWKGNMPLNDAKTEFFDKRIPQIKELVNLKPVELGEGSSLFFFGTGTGKQASGLKDLRLENERGEILYTFTFLDWPNLQTERNQFFAGVSLNLKPGGYRLVVENGAGCKGMMVYAYKGWQTRLFAENCETEVDLSELSITLDRPENGYNPDRQDLRTTALALESLRQSQHLEMPEPSQEQIMLWTKFQNPMLGIYWLHLAMRSYRCQPALMAEVLGNMQELVPDHPDLLAVWHWFKHRFPEHAETCTGRFQSSSKNFGLPPMLRSSYLALMEASWEGHTQIPTESLLDQLAPYILSAGPWLLWNPLPLMAKEELDGPLEVLTEKKKWKIEGLVKREREKKGIEKIQNPRSDPSDAQDQSPLIEVDDAVESLLTELPRALGPSIETPTSNGTARLVPMLVAELVLPTVFNSAGEWRNDLSPEGRQAMSAIVSVGLGTFFSVTRGARKSNPEAANNASYQLTEIPKSFQFELVGKAYLGNEEPLHQWLGQFGFGIGEIDQLVSQILAQLYDQFKLNTLAMLLKMPLNLLTDGLLDALQEITQARQSGKL